jgi:predicted NBD/HSP70 family sugar kinase
LDETLTNLTAMGEGRAVGQLRTGSLESLRERNRLRVVDALRQRGAISRSDIARQTGLSRSTVSSLVSDLQAEGLVVEREVATTPRGPEGGRPPVLIALDQSAGALLGIDFGHRHVRVAVADLSFTVLAESQAEIDVDAAGSEALDLAAGLAEQLLDEAGVPRSRVLGAGMGLPGPIDRQSGLVHSRAIIPSLDGIDTAVEMEMRLRMPVHLDNDANVGALGEATFGAGKGVEVLAYLRLSAGIGAGLIIGGRPFRGARGIAGEIGHVLVDPQGPICRCGNRGCLETFASPPALCELLRRSHGPMTVPRLLALAAEGDAGVRRAVHDAGRVVGRAVADLCNFINPDLVIVGGDLSAAGDLLLDPMREAVRRFAIPAAAEDVRITAGVLGERAEVLGSLALAGHESDDPLTVPVTTMSHQRRRSR